MMKDLKIFTDNIDDKAINQIDLLLEQEAFKDSKIRIMPDVHAGKGCVIGFTGDLGDKVIPNIVGVDIGCGMLCVNLGNIEIDYKKLDQFINDNIPSGMNVNEEKQYDFDLSMLKCFKYLKNIQWVENSIGTLGGGNHFIEIDESLDGEKYLVIHSGSRNLGTQVAEYYQDLANQICNHDLLLQRNKISELINYYKENNRENEIQEALVKLKKEFQISKNKIPYDLAYLENEYRDMYLYDMKICQEFAKVNRYIIAKRICEYMGFDFNNYFESVHNYISFDDNIVRKGAISAKKGEKVIIPINMRDGCIIGIGKGNSDWNNSAPHGAGRVISRTEAMKVVDLKEYQDSMKNIYTTSVNEFTKDEAPIVYKPIKEILENIVPTVDVLKIIKPVYNFKASEIHFKND